MFRLKLIFVFILNFQFVDAADNGATSGGSEIKKTGEEKEEKTDNNVDQSNVEKSNVDESNVEPVSQKLKDEEENDN